MFRNYLAATLRNLVRNRLYAAINIVGLAVGFAAALLIALFVRDEYSYDKWIPGHEQIYLLGFATDAPPIVEGDASVGELAAPLKAEFAMADAVARVFQNGVRLRRGDQEGGESGAWADAEFLDVFKFPVVAGKLEDALARPDSIVLTRRVARKYFGRDDPIGETIEVGRSAPFTVTAVIEDLPSNTHLKFDFLAAGGSALSPQARLAEHPPTDRDFQTSAVTYLKIRSAAAADQVRQGLPAFFRKHKSGVLDLGLAVRLKLTPIADLHFAPGEQTAAPRGNRGLIAAMSAIGVLIVLAAGINFVNLMTARAARRAVEVGVRKAAGAQRAQLVSQFLSESVLYVAVGLVLAVSLCALMLPQLNAFLQRTITFQSLLHVSTVLAILGAGLLIALLAGFFPAFVLSSFHPASVLKAGSVQRHRSSHVREVLVVLQFAILIGLMIATGINVRQNQYALAQAKRLNANQVILIFAPCEGGFREAMRTQPGVLETACSSTLPLGMGGWVDPVEKADGTSVQINQHGVGFGFFEFYGVKPLAGRLFDETRPGDAMLDDPDKVPMHASVIMNEAAVKALGYGTAETAVGRTTRVTLTDNGPRGEPSEIIGVVPDFALDTVNQAVQPTLYFMSPRYMQVLSVRLDGNRIPETLAAIDKLWHDHGNTSGAESAGAQPINRTFLESVIARYFDNIVRQGQLFGIFAAISIFIAVLGLFGMSSALSESRTKEIGIRKAMGADRSDVLGLLLWQFAKPVLWANLIAWPVGAFVMRRWLEGFASHIGLEPSIFIGASVLALAIAIATVIGHALLVVRARPAEALRYE